MSTPPDYENIVLELKKNQTRKEHYQNQIRQMYLVTYGIVLVLGLTFNFILLFVGWQKNKSYNKIAIWVLALAATHLIFCGAAVFQWLYAYYDFEWHYETVTCKLSSYFIYGSMYSTATILSLWSFSSAFSKRACIKRSKNCNIFLILFSWTLAAVLAMPSMFSREVQYSQCVDDYDFDDFKTSPDAIKKLKAVVVSRFLFGLVIPAFVIFVSCSLASKSFHHKCKQCKKQTQLICAVKVAYFVCWGPLIVFTLLQATTNSRYLNAFKYGLPIATALATTHCFICPLIYILGARSIKMHWMVHDPEYIKEGENRSIHLENNSRA